jgi:hypothetical protein
MLNLLKDVFSSLAHKFVILLLGCGSASRVRATFDLDILIDATPYAKKLREAFLAKLGTALTFKNCYEITIFKDRVRIDVQTSTGVEV